MADVHHHKLVEDRKQWWDGKVPVTFWARGGQELGEPVSADLAEVLVARGVAFLDGTSASQPSEESLG